MSESQRLQGYSNLPEAEAQLQKKEPATRNSEPCQVEKASIYKRILRWRRYLILVLTPIVLMPIPVAIPGKVSEAITG